MPGKEGVPGVTSRPDREFHYKKELPYWIRWIWPSWQQQLLQCLTATMFLLSVGNSIFQSLLTEASSTMRSRRQVLLGSHLGHGVLILWVVQCEPAKTSPVKRELCLFPMGEHRDEKASEVDISEWSPRPSHYMLSIW